MHVFVAADGIFYPCCRSVDAQTPNVDHLGKPQRFHSGESIVTAWNSDFMRAVRTDMLAGRRPPACAGCFAVEDLGGESDRQMINRLYPQYVREALSAAVDDGRIECKPRTLDLRVGNICNLQCRMCSPRLSKGLLNEFKMLHGLSDDSEYVRSASRPSWFESENALEAITKLAPYLDEIQFAGGEPLIAPSMFALLRRLCDAGYNEQIELAYITNASVLPKDLSQLWPRFKGVRLAASVDALDAINGLIRYPSNWDNTVRNLTELDLNPESYNCSRLRIFTTVQIYNIFYLEPLIHFIWRELRTFSPFPNFILLTEPDCFSIQALPPFLKERATATLTALLQKEDAYWRPRATDHQVTEFKDKIRTIIAFMNQIDRSDGVNEFLRRNEFHDSYRGQDSLRLIPELAEIAAWAERRTPKSRSPRAANK